MVPKAVLDALNAGSPGLTDRVSAEDLEAIYQASAGRRFAGRVRRDDGPAGTIVGLGRDGVAHVAFDGQPDTETVPLSDLHAIAPVLLKQRILDGGADMLPVGDWHAEIIGLPTREKPSVVVKLSKPGVTIRVDVPVDHADVLIAAFTDELRRATWHTARGHAR